MSDLRLKTKVVFGIGNPGKEYTSTRHNIGSSFIDKLSEYYNTKLKLKNNWLVGETTECFLVKPLSYVNESGIIAKQIIQKYNISNSDFLVIVDDFEIPFGTARLKRKGSSGGHKGLESIIYHLETDDFPRLRIGIGPKKYDAADFVLSKFSKTELKALTELAPIIIQTIDTFIKGDIEQAMIICNSSFK